MSQNFKYYSKGGQSGNIDQQNHALKTKGYQVYPSYLDTVEKDGKPHARRDTVPPVASSPNVPAYKKGGAVVLRKKDGTVKLLGYLTEE